MFRPDLKLNKGVCLKKDYTIKESLSIDLFFNGFFDHDGILCCKST